MATLVLGQQILSQGDFKKLARRRLREAKVLLDNHRYEGAYYLVGYVLEFALKACIAGEMKGRHFPPDRKFIENCCTHDLEKLFKTAGLWSQFDQDTQANKPLRKNWSAIKGWSEEKRYEVQRTSKAVAQDAYSGVADPVHGVLEWIKAHW